MMTLGQKLKNLRLAKEFSQPELAEAVGIEQSYLSKLENDKSFPSDDVFKLLLQALEIELEKFLEDFDSSTIQTQLSKLTLISGYQKQQNKNSASFMMRWLLISSVMVILGGTALVAGKQNWIFEPKATTTYKYESKGIINDDEALRLFEDFNSRRSENDHLLTRLDFQVLIFDQPNGNYFVKQVDGGRRFFVNKGATSHHLHITANNWLMLIGLLSLLAGCIGIIIEHKIRKIRTSFPT
ncbi:MAG: helix-turn-helix domain-containing protein [Colwellia sp.]|nr:helix-turn-helix domain-containing protein [Colwellia sp.]